MKPLSLHIRTPYSFLATLVCSLSLSGYPFVASLATLLGVNNTPLSFFYRAVVLLACLVILGGILANRMQVARGLVWIPIVVFWFLYFIRIFLDTFVNTATLEMERKYYWIWTIGACFIPMIALMSKMNRKSLNRAFFMFFAITSFAGAVFFYEACLAIAEGHSFIMASGRLEFEALNPISVGHLGGSLTIVGAYALLHDRPVKYRVVTILFYIVSLLFGLSLLVFGVSRGPMLATSISLGLLAINRFRSKAGLILVMLTLIVGAGYFLAIYVEENVGLRPIVRILDVANPYTDVTILERYGMLKGAWDQFLKSPILGSGLEERNTGSYPHNVVIESFMATGLFGGLAFLSMLVIASLTGLRMIKKNLAHSWLALLFFQYLIGAMFSGAIWSNTVMWALLGVMFAMSPTVSMKDALSYHNRQPAKDTSTSIIV